jgi:hypothetical protein
MSSVKCLVCEKALEYDDDHGLVTGGGFLRLSFGYGSVYDQGPSGSGCVPFEPENAALNCDITEGYLCDGCFLKKRHLFRGFRDKVVRQRVLVVEAGG